MTPAGKRMIGNRALLKLKLQISNTTFSALHLLSPLFLLYFDIEWFVIKCRRNLFVHKKFTN